MSANEEDSKKPKAGKGKSKAKCHVEVVLNNNKVDQGGRKTVSWCHCRYNLIRSIKLFFFEKM